MAVIDDVQQITGGNTNGGNVTPTSVNAARSFFTNMGTPEAKAQSVENVSPSKLDAVTAASDIKRVEMGGQPVAKPQRPLNAAQTNFVDTLRPEATIASKELGISPETMLAVMAQESGWSGSAKDNNYFNIKGGSGRTVEALEYDAEGNPYYETSTFRNYENAGESMQGYVDFLKSNPRYAGALELAAKGDDDGFLQAIQQAGYATDPNYANTITSIKNRLGVGTPTTQAADAEAQRISDEQAQAEATGSEAFPEAPIPSAGGVDSSLSVLDRLNQPTIVESEEVQQARTKAKFDKIGTDVSKFFNDRLDLVSATGEGLFEAARGSITDAYGDLDSTSKDIVDTGIALLQGASELTGSAIAYPVRAIAEGTKVDAAVEALNKETELGDQITALNAQKTGEPINDANISNQIAKLQEQRGEQTRILDETTNDTINSDLGTEVGDTYREEAESYKLWSDFANETEEAFGGSTAEVGDLEKLDSANQAIDKAFNDSYTDFEEKGVTVETVGDSFSKVVKAVNDNAVGTAQAIVKQLPQLYKAVPSLLSAAGNSLKTALQAFEEKNGREPNEDERTGMLVLSGISGYVGMKGDDIMKGALAPAVSKLGSKLFPDNSFNRLFGNLVGIPARLAAAGGGEAVTEAAESAITQYAGTGEVSGREAFVAGGQGAVLGTGTTAAINTARNPAVQATAKVAAKATVATAKVSPKIVGGTLKGAAIVAKKTPSAVLATTDVIEQAVKGAYNIPTRLRELKQRNVEKAQAAAVAAAVKEEARVAQRDAVVEGTFVREETAEPEVIVPEPTPTVSETPSPEEVVNTIEEVANLSEVAENHVTANADVRGLLDSVVNFSTGFQGLNAETVNEDTDVAQMLSNVSGFNGAMQSTVAQANELLNTNLSPEDKAVVDQVISTINTDTQATGAGAMASLAANNPIVAEGIANLFKFATATDPAEQQKLYTEFETAYVGNTPEERAAAQNAMIQALLKTTLYSGELLGDPSVTTENLRTAANLATDSNTKEQYTALADISYMDSVSKDVLSGTDPWFKGVSTHLADLRTALKGEGNFKPADITSRIDNFYNQRVNKIASLQTAIAQANQTGKPQKLASGIEWAEPYTVHPSIKGIRAAEKLLDKVTHERDLVGYGLQAANTLQGFTSSEDVITAANTFRESAGQTQVTPSLEAEVEPTIASLANVRPVTIVDGEVFSGDEIVGIVGIATSGDEISVSPDIKQGYGEGTYIEVAKQQPDKQIVSSTDLSSFAESLWKKFEKKGWAVPEQIGEFPNGDPHIIWRMKPYNTLVGSTDFSPQSIAERDAQDQLDEQADAAAIAQATAERQLIADNLATEQGVVEQAQVATDTKVRPLEEAVDKFYEPKLNDETQAQYDRRTSNRYKEGTTKIGNSPVWQENTVMDTLTTIAADAKLPVLTAQLTELDFDTTKVNQADLAQIKNLAATRAKFNAKMAKLAKLVTDGDASTGIKSKFKENNVLRQLLDADGNFLPKVQDAAFMAYYNTVQPVGESLYTSDESLVKMLGLTDTDELANIPGLSKLRNLGTAVSSEDFGDAFGRAMGLRLNKGVPLSVQDRINSAMGYSLNSILQTDPEFHTREVQQRDVTPEASTDILFRGFAIRTAENDAEVAEITGEPVAKPVPVSDLFFSYGKDASNAMRFATDPAIAAPKNWIDEVPPNVSENETHIRSTEKLTAAQRKAENLYRKVAWKADTLVSSFSDAMGLDGFKALNGFVEDAQLDELNINERRSVEGTNLKLVDQYEKMNNMLGQLSTNSRIYFTSRFSLVRRQQMQGEVNPQGDKWHRAVLALANSPTITKMNLNNLSGKGVRGDSYYFVLALGQALGVDADKQANKVSYRQTAQLIQQAYNDENSLPSRLAALMEPDGTFEYGSEIPADIIAEFKNQAGGNFHKQQGILTLAKLINATFANGQVSEFEHSLRFEVDGLTNGPFHSTFLTGMGNMTSEQADEYMKRGGFMSDADAESTHSQIGNERFRDFYLTAADKGQEFLQAIIGQLREDIKTGSKGKKFRATKQLEGIEFLETKTKNLSYGPETNELTIERGGTKNPVTVTVYGGGSTGIHRSMANEYAESFYAEMSEFNRRFGQVKTQQEAVALRKELVTQLNGWGNVMYIKPNQDLGVLYNVNQTKSVKEIRDVLKKATLSTPERDALLQTVKQGAGGAITAGIDDVFAGNKHTAALMNSSLNMVTVIANDTFERAYRKIHALRVEQNVINETDSLPKEDVDELLAAIQKSLPFVKSAVQGSSVDVSKQGSNAIAGNNRVSAPSLTTSTTTAFGKNSGKAKLSGVGIKHSTTGFASPGVRGIPVLTISVDANTMVLNHLLQTKNGKTLNVLDANDTVADKDVRYSNEVFNAAEFMSMMASDPLRSVQLAMNQSITFNSKPFEVAGISIDPILTTANLQNAPVEDSQEQLRQALNDLSLPIHKGLPSFRDSGNLQEAMTYIAQQLEIERANAQVARNRFVFDNPSLLMNQMAGIDNGGARIEAGQIKLSSKAKALIGESGVATVDNFNKQQAARKNSWDASDKQPIIDTRAETLRQEAAIGSNPAREQLAYEFDQLTGLFQGLRANGRYDSDTVSYDLANQANQAKFKELLFGSEVARDFKQEEGNEQFVTNGYIPNNGILFEGGANQKNIDKILKNVTIEITTDLPKGVDGSMTVDNGKYHIKILKGISTKDASIVLQHEMTHALVANGLAKGVNDLLSKTASFERSLVQEQMQQIRRFIRWQATQPATPESALLQKYMGAYKADSSAENLNRLLQEHMALVAANGLAENFHRTALPTEVWQLNDGFGKYVTDSLKSVLGYIQKVFGKFSYKDERFISEADIFANLLSGYATSGGVVPTNTKQTFNSTMTEPQKSVLVEGEQKLDGIIRSKSGEGIAGLFRLLGKINPSYAGAAAKYTESTPSQRAAALQSLRDEWLHDGKQGERMGVIKEILSEFFARDREDSQIIDSIQQRKTTSSDAAREDTKVTVANALEESFGGLTDEQAKAVTNGVLRADLGTIYAGAKSLPIVQAYLTDPSSLDAAITTRINQVQNNLGLSKQQSNLMLNEARALGKRSITGGSYEGFNLPNAKAIANLYGTGITGSTALEVELNIDALSTFYALQEMSADDKTVMAQMLGEQANRGGDTNGFEHAIRKQRSIKGKLVTRHGSGVLNGLPKGFLPELAEAGSVVRVVTVDEAKNMKGWTKVRDFNREGADPVKDKMVLMSNTEGSTASYVQGAASIIETSVGGFISGTGRATDKSLPYFGASKAQRGITEKKLKLSRRLSKGLVNLKAKEDGMLPNINSMGQIIGYRYAISNAEKTELVGLESNAGTLLGTYDARIAEEKFAEDYNTELASALGAAYLGRSANEDDDYVKLSANSSDPQIVNTWDIMPRHLKTALAEEFGGNFAYVHKRDLNNAFGYREWSISELWKESAEGTKKGKFADVLEVVLGSDASRKIRWAERTLQAGISDVKDLIVVKSIVVPAANILSNVNQLHLRGVPAEDIIRDAKRGGIALNDYKENKRQYNNIIEAMEVATPAQFEEMRAESERLNQAIENSPIATLLRAGLLPTVVEDFNQGGRDTLVGDFIGDAVPEYGENTFVDIGKEVIIANDSQTYAFLNKGLEAGDFVAKFILFEHLTRNGMNELDALRQASAEFINYTSLSPRSLDYLNKTGAVSFFKYFSRIQAIIANTVVQNPTRALTTYIGADTIGLPSIFDALWVTKDLGNTTGVYDLLSMAGGAHPITGNLL